MPIIQGQRFTKAAHTNQIRKIANQSHHNEIVAYTANAKKATPKSAKAT